MKYKHSRLLCLAFALCILLEFATAGKPTTRQKTKAGKIKKHRKAFIERPQAEQPRAGADLPGAEEFDAYDYNNYEDVDVGEWRKDLWFKGGSLVTIIEKNSLCGNVLKNHGLNIFRRILQAT